MTRKVGYKSPPDHTKWVKGQSGNPTGRKKGQRNLATDLAEELASTIQLTEGGRVKRVTRQQAVVKGLVARSMKGDPRAVSELIKLILRHGQEAEAAIPSDVTHADDEALIAAFLDRQTIGEKA